MAFGFLTSTELYKSGEANWVEYREMPTDQWRSRGCLVQHGYDGNIYNIRNAVEYVDPSEPTDDNVFQVYPVGGDLPIPFYNPGTCGTLNEDEPGMVESPFLPGILSYSI